MTWWLTSTETVRLSKDGGEGGMKVGEEGGLYTYRYIVNARMTLILRWAVMRASFINCEGQSHNLSEWPQVTAEGKGTSWKTVTVVTAEGKGASWKTVTVVTAEGKGASWKTVTVVTAEGKGTSWKTVTVVTAADPGPVLSVNAFSSNSGQSNSRGCLPHTDSQNKMCSSQFLNIVKWQTVYSPFLLSTDKFYYFNSGLQKWPEWYLHCINPDPGEPKQIRTEVLLLTSL